MSLLALRTTIKNTDNRRIGFIAQEIELVVPEVVSSEEGAKGTSYVHLALDGAEQADRLPPRFDNG